MLMEWMNSKVLSTSGCTHKVVIESPETKSGKHTVTLLPLPGVTSLLLPLILLQVRDKGYPAMCHHYNGSSNSQSWFGKTERRPMSTSATCARSNNILFQELLSPQLSDCITYYLTCHFTELFTKMVLEEQHVNDLWHFKVQKLLLWTEAAERVFCCNCFCDAVSHGPVGLMGALKVINGGENRFFKTA